MLDLIESLIGKSLVRRVGMSAEVGPRFGLLETIREYGFERLADSGEETPPSGRGGLGEEMATREAHAAHFLAFAERADLERIGPAQPQWLARLDDEHANLRAALTWLTVRSDLAAALRLAAACGWFWWYRGHYAEGRARLETLFAQSTAAAHERAWAGAMTAHGLLTHAQGDMGRAVEIHEAAVTAWRDLAEPDRLAEALYLSGFCLMYADDDRAIPVLSECLAITRTLPDQAWLGVALWALGRARYYQGDLGGAEQTLVAAQVQFRERGNPLGFAFVDWSLGELAWDQGNEAEALPLLRQALAQLWDLKEAWSAILCLERLAAIAARDDAREPHGSSPPRPPGARRSD